MATKTYNFKQQLLDLDDSPVNEGGKDIYLNELLANHIRNTSITEDIVLKFFGWAVDLKKTGELSLDDVDRDSLKKFILSSHGFPTLSKGRLSQLLDNAVEPKKATK